MIKLGSKQLNILDKVYVGLLFVIFSGIILHTPLSVGLSSIWPQGELLIKSWKEILMIIASPIGLYLIFAHRQKKLLHDPLILAIMAYGILHLVMLAWTFTGATSTLAGLAIDLRYVLYFGLVYVAFRLFPEYRKDFVKVGIAGALVVVIFAFLQVFVLPHDVLKYIGYNKETIAPYLTIDKNNSFVRINSTLRGPNPLGAYASIVLTLLTAYIASGRLKRSNNKKIIAIMGILLIGGLVALWVSYSRSALVGTIIAVLLVSIYLLSRHFSTKLWISLGAILVIIGGGLFLVRESPFVSNVIFHVNPSGGSSNKSDEGHISSLQSGFAQLAVSPFGSGVGSTGSASLYTKSPEIIENQYLFIAHEVGWLGLGYFLFIFGLTMKRLWQSRSDWLSIGVFASGVSLAVIGFLLPVWVDDTVSIVWWGLAALALSPQIYLKYRRLDKGAK